MKIRNNALIRLAATVFTGAMWVLFRTLKLEYRLEQPGTNPYCHNQVGYLVSLWHDCIVIATFGGTHQNSSALTSRHADGSFVAQVLQLVGVTPIRGSTNHISPAAVRQLLETPEHQNIVIAPDGPRGPTRQMSVGIVHLASCTGRAVVPTAYGCSRYWRIKGSWSDMIIPKPFARVFLLAGKPVEIPEGLKAEDRQEFVRHLQNEMDRLTEIADSLAGRKSTAETIL